MCHGLHWAACTLGPGDPHRRPVEQKKEGLGSIVSPGGPARKQQTLALISSSNSNWDLIPTHATPNYALPLQQSRTSLPNPSRQRCSASLPKPGPAYSSLPKHPGWSNIRPTCQNPSPVTPRPLPGPPPPQAHPMAMITMIRMTLKTPSSRLQGRALPPGGQGGRQKH